MLQQIEFKPVFNICEAIFFIIFLCLHCLNKENITVRSESVQGQKTPSRNMSHLHADLKLMAADPHPITGHGENASSPTKKVKVNFQPAVQREQMEK